MDWYCLYLDCLFLSHFFILSVSHKFIHVSTRFLFVKKLYFSRTKILVVWKCFCFLINISPYSSNFVRFVFSTKIYFNQLFQCMQHEFLKHPQKQTKIVFVHILNKKKLCVSLGSTVLILFYFSSIFALFLLVFCTVWHTKRVY
jgi:hypothetical protein